YGVGGAAFRTVRHRAMYVDTVPFPAYTRAAVERAGPYDETLVRNQDDEYNYRLRKLGGRILLAPDVRSRYISRQTLRQLWEQYYQYGFYKVRVMQKHPRQMRPRQFVPPLFASALIGGALLAPFLRMVRVLWGLLLLVYLCATLLASLLTARRTQWRHLPRLPLAYATLHLSYGLGFLSGLIHFR
ncbi:MAG: glycosyltransferase family 2 protein, partial [Chloroflexi bacterium]|nr:glycosyltransferase family 2 protein [Chloroflexota bacterium]